MINHEGKIYINGQHIALGVWIEDGKSWKEHGSNTLFVSPAYYDRLKNNYKEAVKEKLTILIFPKAEPFDKIICSQKTFLELTTPKPKK